MMLRRLGWCLAATVASADNILQTAGFSNCGNNANNADISVQKLDIRYNSNNQSVTFDVAGTSTKRQNVTAMLNVTAYGIQVYANTFNPCDANAATFVAQLCPVPVGSFAARGVQAIPAQFANAVPAIAFRVPDIAAQAMLQLMASDSDTQVACIQSQVTNGKTTDVPAVSYVAAAVAAAALVLSGVSAIGAVGAGAVAGTSSSTAGMGTVSPSFGEVLGWFQGMAMNSMLSVSYPPVYRHFAKNFAFSTGLVQWTDLQIAIDNFRVATGGNLTNDSVHFLQNATLVFPDGSTDGSTDAHNLLRRAIASTDNADNAANAANTVRVAVSGIQAYAEALSIPSASTFMTVLLIVAIVLASITVGLLLVKLVLEAWALIGRFPASLADFRQHYWRSIARANTTLILLLYGVWVLYCMFQFTHGDSWAAKLLAGLTLGLFTAVLAYFSVKIGHTARTLKQQDGDVARLYDDHAIWAKYSLFYESYRRPYWWLFVPAILYMFAKGVALAVGDGHGRAQTIAQLVIESLMLLLLLGSRPYERRSGNVVNIAIQLVRVLSVVCIFLFVDEFAIAETTQTVAGVVLIALQSALSVILALLIAWNAVAACIKKNPHEQRRKEREKELEMARADDNLTPLYARNSLLRGTSPRPDVTTTAASSMMPAAQPRMTPSMPPSRHAASVAYSTPSASASASAGAVTIGLAVSSPPDSRSLTPIPRRTDDGHSLLGNEAPMGQAEPTLPKVGLSPAMAMASPDGAYPMRSSTYSAFPARDNGYRAFSRGYLPYRPGGYRAVS